MEIIDETEDLIYIWIMTLPIAEQREIHNGSDIINCIDEEAEQEMKDVIWESIKNSISYMTILNRLNIHLNSIIKTPEESEEESEEEEFKYY
jgi:hypothetical protein